MTWPGETGVSPLKPVDRVGCCRFAVRRRTWATARTTAAADSPRLFTAFSQGTEAVVPHQVHPPARSSEDQASLPALFLEPLDSGVEGPFSNHHRPRLPQAVVLASVGIGSDDVPGRMDVRSRREACCGCPFAPSHGISAERIRERDSIARGQAEPADDQRWLDVACRDDKLDRLRNRNRQGRQGHSS